MDSTQFLVGLPSEVPKSAPDEVPKSMPNEMPKSVLALVEAGCCLLHQLPSDAKGSPECRVPMPLLPVQP